MAFRVTQLQKSRSMFSINPDWAGIFISMHLLVIFIIHKKYIFVNIFQCLNNVFMVKGLVKWC